MRQQTMLTEAPPGIPWTTRRLIAVLAIADEAGGGTDVIDVIAHLRADMAIARCRPRSRREAESQADDPNGIGRWDLLADPPSESPGSPAGPSPPRRAGTGFIADMMPSTICGLLASRPPSA